jgi:hypothetical protein
VKSTILANFLQAPYFIIKKWWVVLLVHWSRKDIELNYTILKVFKAMEK